MAHEIVMKKLANGALVPVNQEEADKLSKIPVGEVVRTKLTVFRNYKVLRKYMVLIKFLYDQWTEWGPRLQYRGEEVRPNIERFRKDVQILCGWYEPEFGVRGELRLVSKSVSFSAMTEPDFEQLYSTVIDVGLSKVMVNPHLTAEQVREACERLMHFCD